MPEKMQRPAICLLLIAATLLAFVQVLDGRFINFDDPGYVTNNVHVRSGISAQTIMWAFTSTDEVNWHPLTWISHALDCTLFGLDARYHHAMNLLLHILSSILVFIVFEKMTRARWQSAFVALVFALHPLHVESVAWIAERKDVLSGFFWMLTLLAYERYRRSPVPGRYLLTFGAFLLGVLSKPVVVTLPFVLVLLDYWPFRRFEFGASRTRKVGKGDGAGLAQSVLEKIPFFVIALASSVVTFLIQQRGGATKVLYDVNFPNRIANALFSYARYLQKTVLPIDLAVFYPHPGGGLPLWQAGAAAILLVLISVLVWKQRIQRPFLVVGWFWFLGTLVPVIGLVQVGLQGMADRYMYLPMIGLSIMVAWGVPLLLQRAKMQGFVLRSAFILVVALMIVGTRAQSSYWRDSRSVFEHAVAVTSDNYVAQNNLGAALADSGDHSQAIAHLRESLRIKPDYLEAHHNIARSLVAQGNAAEALEHYTVILRRVPEDPRLHELMGTLYSHQGKEEDALSHFSEVLRLEPANVNARCRMAEIYAQQGKFDDAREECSRALELQPASSQAHQVMGTIAGQQHLDEDAVREFSEAIRCDSTNAAAYNNLGIMYDRMGRGAEAMEMYQTAVRHNPSAWDAHLNLGTAFAVHGKYGDAASHWARAIELNPSSVDARANLGRLYAMQGRSDLAVRQFTEALRIDSNNVQAHLSYGNLLAREGKFAEAEAQYSAVLRVAPSSQAAQTALQQVRSHRTR
jgi:tetratricopeptide (TPR) repeat protein